MTKRKCENWLDTYLTYVDNTEPPLMYKKWCGISAISMAMERKCFMPWVGGFTWYPNMYIVLVGPPGQVRKSTAMRPMVDIMANVEGLNIAANSTTREALIRRLANSSSEYFNSHGKSMKHCSMAIVASELAVLIGGNSGQLMCDLSDWWDCDDSWEYDTKHQGNDSVNGVWVTMLGATTPDLMNECLPVDMVGSGFASRIIFVYEQKMGKLVPFPEQSENEILLKENLVHDIKLINEMEGEFKVTDCFKEGWEKWYSDNYYNPPFTDKKLVGYTSRRPTHTMKLCMLLSASKGDSMLISSVELDEAVDLLKETEKKMPMTFAGMGKLSDGDIVSSIMIEIANKKTVTYSKLLNRFYTDVNKRTFDDMIEALRQMDFLKISYVDKEKTIIWKKDGKADSQLAKSLKG